MRRRRFAIAARPIIPVVNSQGIFGQLQGVMQDVRACRAFTEKLVDDQ